MYHPYLAAPTVSKKKEQRDEKHKAAVDNGERSPRIEVTLYWQASHCKEQCRIKAKSIKWDFKENSEVTESMFAGNVSPARTTAQRQQKTGYLRTWELVSALKARWWIRWKQWRALAGRTGGRRTGPHREQPKRWSGIPSRSISLNHHYVLIQIPWDVSFHATQQTQHIYGLNIFKSSVFLFLWAFKYSPLRASLFYFKLHKADCLPLWLQTYLKHLNK